MLWRPPRRSWCMHRILCTACNRNSTRSFERGHDGNILEEAYRGRYARQRLLNFWPESSCGYHAIKRFVCIIQVTSIFAHKRSSPQYSLLGHTGNTAETTCRSRSSFRSLGQFPRRPYSIRQRSSSTKPRKSESCKYHRLFPGVALLRSTVSPAQATSTSIASSRHSFKNTFSV